MPTSWAKTIKFMILAVFIGMLLMMSGCGKQSSSVSGTITYGGLPLQGITVSLSGSGTATTDANGRYTFSDLSDGTYTITPTMPVGSNYMFLPSTRTAYLTQTDAGGFDFAAICPNRVATSQHTLFVQADRTVLAWGNNSHGQLGNGTGGAGAYSTTPVPVTGLTDVIAVAAGADFSLALKSDKTVVAWGRNDHGQLGNGNKVEQHTFVPVSLLTDVKSISAGSAHATAVKNDGTIWVWGSNAAGQLGLGAGTAETDIPVQITSLSGILSASAGYNHTLALRSDTQVLAWGNNDKGQLGDGTVTTQYTPISSGINTALQVSAGNQFSVALTFSSTFYNGTVVTWGINTDGQLGNGTTSEYNATPTMINNFTNIAFVSAGSEHAVAVKRDGTVWAWGDNTFGQLGDGTVTDKLSPVQASADPSVTAFTNIWIIAAGDDDTIAYKSSGNVWGWGINNKGQLGIGNTTDQSRPVLIQ